MAAMTASNAALPPLQPLAHYTVSANTASPIPKAIFPIPKPTPRSSLSEAQRWHHLSTRTPSSTPFIYAVLTTKIYCLPTCPSRLARRANIVFFSSPQEAECKGFRACKRCKPDLSPSFLFTRSGNLERAREQDHLSAADDNKSPPQNAANTGDQATTTINARPSENPEFDPTDPSLKLHQAISLVQAKSQAGEKISLMQLAQEVGLSKWHLQRAFKRRCGRSPREMGEALLREKREYGELGGIADGLGATSAGEISGSTNMSIEASSVPSYEPLPTLPASQDTITALEMGIDPNLRDSNVEAGWKLGPATPNWDLRDSTSTGSSAPAFSSATDGLTESTSSFATTPAPPTEFSPMMMDIDMDFTYDTNFYPDGFSPDVEGVLRDLFPEIYDENMVEGQGKLM